MRARPATSILGLCTGVTALASSLAVFENGERGAAVPSHPPSARSPSRAATPAVTRAARLPVRFEPNEGQLDARVRYLARARGLSLFLTDDGATLRLGQGRSATTTLRMRVVGTSRPLQPTASGRLAGISSYFIGSDRSRWRAVVPGYGRVTYRDVVPGVDQVFHDDGEGLEYDFVVSPGARVEAINLAFDGADSLRIDASGNLQIQSGNTAITQVRPRIYQSVDGHRVAVAGGYRVTGPSRVAFDVGRYDRAEPLVIDPVLAYASYLGGSGDDYAYGVATDAAGAIYVTGFTSSADFPTASAYGQALVGNEDAFVTKLSPDGSTLVYSTYLGGHDDAFGYGIAVDATGAAYIVGTTDSADFPAEVGAQSSLGGKLDAFVAKLSPDGSSLAYSSYLGGDQDDEGYGIAVDAIGAAYVVGATYGGSFPSTDARPFGGGIDAFVAKVGPTGSSFAFATLLGGAQDDAGQAIAVDASGDAYVTGYTGSLDFPTGGSPAPFQALNAGNQNAFVSKLTPDGTALVYSTFLGGSQSDRGKAIAVDEAGSAYVTGFATSADFPTASAYQPALQALGGYANAFVTKLDSTGAKLVYSTFLGGSGDDEAQGIAVGAAGDTFVTGFTSSGDFPIADAVQGAFAATTSPEGTNAFLTRLNATGSKLVYSTYLGGSVGDSAEAIAVSLSGAAYLVGYTISPDFPVMTPEQRRLGGSDAVNAFVAVIGERALDPDASVDATDAWEAGGADEASIDAGSAFGDAALPAVDSGSAPHATIDGGCSCRTSIGARSGREDPDGLGGAVGGAFLIGGALVFRRRRSWST